MAYFVAAHVSPHCPALPAAALLRSPMARVNEKTIDLHAGYGRVLVPSRRAKGHQGAV
jgi:hypothetical protein